MRLDYFLAHATGLSRKEVKRLIGSRRVRVGGQERPTAGTAVTDQDEIWLDDERLVLEPGHRYLMLHKPAGVVSATRDGLHRTVLDLIPLEQRRDLHPVGRLDRDTTGLLLLTTDGQWSHRVTAPRSHCDKTYRVELAQPLEEAALVRLRTGVTLRSEAGPTRPAQVEVIDALTLRLTLTEGRYHQVKRMLAAVGNHVMALHRESVGQIRLDPDLQPGEYRPLSEAEVNLFR